MPRGGKRPGAGRKPSDVEQYRREMERTLLAGVTEGDWHAVVAKALAQAKEGDAGARQWLSDRVMGKVRDKVDVEQQGEIVVRVIRDRAGGTAPLRSAPGAEADQG